MKREYVYYNPERNEVFTLRCKPPAVTDRDKPLQLMINNKLMPFLGVVYFIGVL